MSKSFNNKNWIIKLSLFSAILSFLIATPPYYAFKSFSDINNSSSYLKTSWDGYLERARDPLKAVDWGNKIHHSSKLTFRLVPILTAKFLKLEVKGLLAIQILFFLSFMYLFSRLVYDISQDKLITIFLSFSLATTYTGNILVSDIRGNFDILAFSFILLAMLSNKPLWIFIFILLAGYTDERGLVATSFVLLWQIIKNSDSNKLGLGNFIKPSATIYSVYFAWVFYFALRWYLASFYQLSIGKGGINLFFSQLNAAPIAMFLSLEGFFLIIGAGLIILLLQKNFLAFLTLSGSIFILNYLALSVQDVGRSMAYIFPSVFIALFLLIKSDALEKVRALSFICLVICALFPTYAMHCGREIIFAWPFPLRIFGFFWNFS